MNKEALQKAIEALKKTSPKRKFTQKYDLIITLKNLDLKVPEQQVEQWISLPHPEGKQTKICALVGGELAEQAKKACDFVILNEEFKLYAPDKKKIKKLANEYTYFIAQANMMQEIAKVFGRILGPRGKMPNPKAGCVVPPNANLAPLVERLKKTIKISAKTQPVIKCVVGTEKMSDDHIIENVLAVYSPLIHALPEETNNVKAVLLKFTMSKPIKVWPEAEANHG